MAMKTLAKFAMAIPKPIRRFFVDSNLFQRVLKKTAGNKRTILPTPEGQEMVVHPIYHAQLVAMTSLDQYEPIERKVIGQLCRPGMVAYDVGANVGIFACFMSTLVGEKGRVIAFEPETNNSHCLEATIKLNNLHNMHLEKKAVGRVTEMAQFDGRGGAFSGRLVDHGQYKTTNNVVSMEVVSLDDMVNQGFPPPDLIKIDVEGNELMVLEGMQQIFRTTPPIVLCEIHSYLGDPSKKVVDLLSQYDYEMFEVDSMAAGKLSPITDLKGRDWLIACPRAKRNCLLAA